MTSSLVSNGICENALVRLDYILKRVIMRAACLNSSDAVKTETSETEQVSDVTRGYDACCLLVIKTFG